MLIFQGYKAGDTSQNLEIPDLVLLDQDRKLVINGEGKKVSNTSKGLKQLDSYDAFEELYVKKYYKAYDIVRTLILYGGKGKNINDKRIGFLLNELGDLITTKHSPKLFKEAVQRLQDFWK